MNYRKVFNHITRIGWTTIAVTFVMCTITPNNAQAKFLFEARVDYDAGGSPYSVAVGDLDGDANPDLAVANRASDNVSLLWGNGDGSFQSAVNYSAGSGPEFIAIDDLDGDANPDLAVANFRSNNVSVLIGNGDGSFQRAVHYGAGSGPKSVAIGDLNGDGDPDLAVANAVSDNVSILINTGEYQITAEGNQNQLPEARAGGGGSSSGCFIATAIYGSGLSKEVFVFMVLCSFLLIRLSKTREKLKK